MARACSGDERLSFSANRQGLNGKQVVLFRVEGCHKERFKGRGNFLGGCKAESLNTLGWRKTVRSSVGLKRLGAAVSC